MAVGTPLVQWKSGRRASYAMLCVRVDSITRLPSLAQVSGSTHCAFLHNLIYWVWIATTNVAAVMNGLSLIAEYKRTKPNMPLNGGPPANGVDDHDVSV